MSDHGNQRPLEVAVLGAGFSGIGAAIKLLGVGITNFRVFDKASGVGGTWFHTRYPGAACDVSSHLYCYSFEPNPGWSRVYSPQEEIREYLEHCVKKYNVSPHLVLETEAVSVRFCDTSSHWRIDFLDGGSVSAQTVIVALGGLHFPAYPTISGKDAFQGQAMHTAEWDHAVSLQGKNVGIIGSAASAIQVIPEIAQSARKLTVFQRTPNWILPRNDRAYSPAEQSRFANWRWLQYLYRHYLFLRSEFINFRLVKTKDDNLVRRQGEALAKEYICSTVKDASLHKQLIPDYPMGCKRVLLSDDYYQTLNEEHVTLETTPIARFEPKGIITTDGSFHDLDVVVYATGYDLDAWLNKMSIVGSQGVSLKSCWKHLPSAYRGVCIPKFPNLYMVTGPNTGVGSTSIVYLIEAALDFILQAIQVTGNNKLLSVTDEAHAAYNKQIQQDLGKTVWAAGCKSWYKRPDGKIPTLYPYDARTFRRQHRKLNRKHFTITPITEKAAAFAGNADDSARNSS